MGRHANNRPLTAEQRALAVKYWPLARSMANRWKKIRPRFADEFESAASFAVVMAARAYDTSSKVSFATYAMYRIYGEMMEVGNSLEQVSLKPTDPDSVKPIEFLSNVNMANFQSKPVSNDAVDSILGSFPPKVANALRLTCLEGYTQAEASRAMGCSQAEILRLVKLAGKLSCAVAAR